MTASWATRPAAGTGIEVSNGSTPRGLIAASVTGRNRRNPVINGCSGEGPLTEPTAVLQVRVASSHRHGHSPASVVEDGIYPRFEKIARALPTADRAPDYFGRRFNSNSAAARLK